MATPDSYIRQISELDIAIKRNREQGKKLREQKSLAQSRLYAYMVRHGMEEYQGIKVNKIKPPLKTKRKSNKRRREDGIRLFHQVGIPDPESFWNEFQGTQKILPDV
jgi:hypothetical protein